MCGLFWGFVLETLDHDNLIKFIRYATHLFVWEDELMHGAVFRLFQAAAPQSGTKALLGHLTLLRKDGSFVLLAKVKIHLER